MLRFVEPTSLLSIKTHQSSRASYKKCCSLLLIIFLALSFHTTLAWEHEDDDKDLSGCAVEIDGNIFNLKDISRDTDDDNDYEVTYNDGSGDVTINFNICEYNARQCSDGQQDYANSINSNNTCNHLSSSDISDVQVELIDIWRPDLGLELTYFGGNQCNSTSPFSLTIQINCVEDLLVPTYSLDTKSLQNPCSPKVIMSSGVSCPHYSLYELWYFFSDYDYLFGIVGLAYGVFLVALGGKHYRITMFLAGQFVVAFAILLGLYLTVYPSYSPEWTVWVTLVAALAIGAGVGYAGSRWARVGVLFLGGIVGGGIGAFIYGVGFYGLSDDHPYMVLWLTVAGVAFLVALISMIFFDYAVIIYSAIIGGYIFMRAMGVFCGNYPSELTLFEDIRNNTLDEIPWQFWLYFTFWWIVAVVSCIVQFLLRARYKEQYSYRKYDFKYRKN